MKKAPENVESGFYENGFYQIEIMSLEDTKEKLNDVTVRLNDNLKIHMGFKIEMIWHVYIMTK